MKKTLTAAALSSVLVLGLAAASQAADATTGVNAAGASKVTLDGNVRMRGYYDRDNAAQDKAGKSAYDTKVQLGTKAQVSDQATGYIKLESGFNSSDVQQWGKGDAAGLTTGGDKNDGLTVLEAWLNYQPGAWGVKAGHMPLFLGNKIFFDHTGSGDDALVFYANPSQATHIGALTIKFDEQTVNDGSDDLDGYVALITHKMSDTMNLGANWTHLVGSSSTGGDAIVQDADLDGVLDSSLAQGMGMSNIGLNIDGKVGAISYLADAEFQFGDLYDNGTDQADAGGWAAKLAGTYDLGAGKVGLLLGYGSGEEENDTDNDYDGFVNFLTDTTYDTIIAGYRSAIPGARGVLGNTLNTGLSNLTLIQLNASTKGACPLTGKDVSLFASASYMQLSEDRVNGTNADGSDSMVDGVGTELDLIATWALTPGLSYKVEAAYMFVGDAYETVAAGVASDTDNLMFIRHGLDLKF